MRLPESSIRQAQTALRQLSGRAYRVYALLEQGPRDVTALHTELDTDQPTMSQLLAGLRRLGLVVVTRDGRRRVYSINAAAADRLNALLVEVATPFAPSNPTPQ